MRKMLSKIKKFWLISSTIYVGYLLINGFLYDHLLRYELGLIFFTLVIPFGYLILVVLDLFALYRFFIKKQGTVWLSLNMTMAIARIGFILSLNAMISSVPQWGPYFMILHLLLTAQWLVFSFLLRRENILMRKTMILDHPEYQAALKEIALVANVEDLNSKYGECVRNNPRISGALKKNYKKKLLELSR